MKNCIPNILRWRMVSFRNIFVVGDVFSQKTMRINKNNFKKSPQKLEISKATFSWFTVFLFD